MKKNIIKETSFVFAVRIVHLCRLLSKQKSEYVISRQMLKSGTAIGALYREAEHAESTSDFIHKMSLAQKECNETIYWLELLHACDLLSQTQFNSLHKDAVLIIKLITSIIKTKKTNQKRVTNC